MIWFYTINTYHKRKTQKFLFSRFLKTQKIKSKQHTNKNMPLRKCASQNCFDRNVATEVRSGKPVKQAVAIAYSVKRKAIAQKAAQTRKKKS